MPPSLSFRFHHPVRFVFIALVVGVLSTACATVPTDPEARAEFERINDPLEPTNRVIQDFNDGVDRIILKPIAQLYDFILPDFIQDRVTQALANLSEPFTLANNILQGDPEAASETLARFLTNSTIGLGGMFNVAAEGGLERRPEDFGQTLAVWGVGEGPYLVLPFLGPSNPRDTVGLVAEFFGDPVDIAFDQFDVKNASLIRTATLVVDARARNLDTLDELRAGSLDYYATLRSAYRQLRAAQIHNGAPPPTDAEDDLFDDFDGLE